MTSSSSPGRACRSDDRSSRRRPAGSAGRRRPSSSWISRTRCRRRPAASPRSWAWRGTSPGVAARSRSRGQHLRVRPGEPLRDWADEARAVRIFVKEVDDPENFGVVLYDDDKRVADIVEKAGVVDTRFDSPPSSHAVVGPTAIRPTSSTSSRLASSRGELEITDVNRPLRATGRLDVRGRGLVGGRRQALAAPRRHRPPHRRDGANKRDST